MQKLILLVLLVFVAGCTQADSGEKTSEELATELCQQICQAYSGDLSNGPCLSDGNSDWTVDDWVCDVAHDPRQDLDNQQENQCQDYRDGKASHFVEVDESCEFIIAY